MLATGLFGAIFAARLTIHGTDPITVFLIFPVALLAMAFGLRAGLIAGLIGVVLTVAWVALQGISLSALGWVVRVLPIVLLGVLVGWTTDRERAAEQTERALFEARLREREAAEINDSIVQRLAVAKWTMEAGHTDEGLTMLADTIATSESLVVALLRHEPLPHSGPEST
jgi:energy-coupling factor transporter transmembrane protein EcfT